MATGMAIMGFGGGAMIGAPLADLLMKHFATPTSVGVEQTFLTMGAIYFVAMLAGAFGYRVPPADWTVPVSAKRQPRALTAEHVAAKPAMITTRRSIMIVSLTSSGVILTLAPSCAIRRTCCVDAGSSRMPGR